MLAVGVDRDRRRPRRRRPAEVRRLPRRRLARRDHRQPAAAGRLLRHRPPRLRAAARGARPRPPGHRLRPHAGRGVSGRPPSGVDPLRGDDHVRTLVIVGASLAGAKAAEAARDSRLRRARRARRRRARAAVRTTAAVQGGAPRRGRSETTRVHATTSTPTNDIELLTGRTVDGLDVRAGQIHLDGRGTCRLRRASWRRAPRRGASTSPAPTSTASTTSAPLGDARRLGDAVRSADRVAVVGAGWIGSEVAASARQMGAEVVLVDPVRCRSNGSWATRSAGSFRHCTPTTA